MCHFHSKNNNKIQIFRLNWVHEKVISKVGFYDKFDFTYSWNSFFLGGLIGLAAMAIGMGEESASYVSELVKPVLNCMDDSDSRVRFYACESLYNVTKVVRDAILPLFNECFIAMAKVSLL